MRLDCCLLIILAGLVCLGPAHSTAAGILGEEAPQLGVEEWFNLPPGQGTIEIANFKGKIVHLYCFQSWCPGCHSHGFPVLTELLDHYEDDDDVVFLAVQTHAAIALDLDWSELDRFYLSTGNRGATSAWSLVDAAGVIRFAQPGQVTPALTVALAEPVDRLQRCRPHVRAG